MGIGGATGLPRKNAAVCTDLEFRRVFTMPGSGVHDRRNTQYRPDRNRLGFSREKDRQTGVDTKLDVLRHLRTLVPRQ